MDRRISGLLVSLTLGTACTADPVEQPQEQTTGVPGSSSGPAPVTGPGSSGTELPGGSTTTPGESTAGGSTSASSGDGPEFYFDLGIPDSPGDQECQQDIDIVFVMDVSTTMGTFINLLSMEMLAVDAAVQAYDLPSEPHYGLAVFVDDAVLLNGGVPYPDASMLQADFDLWAAFTASNQQVGGGNLNTTFHENSLDALYFAADQFQWRPAETTTRIIIHTTDDTFWDGPTTGNGVPIQHSYGETVQALQDETVRVYAFTDDIGGACNCDDVTPGWSTPYMGMTTIPEATDGGSFEIEQILGGMVSLADAITSAVDESYCDPYDPVG